MQNSDRPTEICTNQLLSIPIDGRWIWDEKRKELVYESRHRMNDDKKSSSNELLKIDLRSGLIHYRKQNRPLQYIIKTKDNNKITLDDIIQASLNVMSEMFYIPIEFEEYVSMLQVHEFLLYLLNYFYWFFETMDNTLSKNERYIDRSQMEKNHIRIAYANLLACLRELGCKYAILLLGINLKYFHHMRNGDLYYSCTYIDRTIYESLFIFSTYFTWITFYRQNFDLIRNELARLFRADGDVEMLQIPMTESLEGRIKNDILINSINRHKLIDCTEIFSKSMAKKAAITRTSEIQNKKSSLRRTSSIFWNFNKISNESNRLIKQQTSKNRLNNVLAKDFNEQGLIFLIVIKILCYLSIEEFVEDDELYGFEFDMNSPYHHQRQKLFISQRKNCIRGILTKQLKSRNQSLIEEQYRHLKNKKTNEQLNMEEIENKIREREKMKRERLIKQQILNSSFYKNSSILPAPPNPLDNPRIMKDNQLILPKIQFKLKENIGIIGKSYSDFDLLRLTLKPNIEDNINIPTEFLVTLPDQMLARATCSKKNQCLSKWGYCGTGLDYCGDGCQAGPCTGTTTPITTSTTAGGLACSDPTQCRSKWGYCGTGSAYCGDGCQAGPCMGTTTPITTSTTAGGLACSDPTQCRSKWGYCGTGSDYCGDGCQAGPCTGTTMIISTSTSANGSIGVIDTNAFACVFNTINATLRASRFDGLKATGWTPMNKNEAAVFLAHRCEKIQIIDAIKNREGQINDYNFKFLQHHKNDEEIHNYSTNPIKQLNLTESDIEKIIENAFESAKKYVTMVNMSKLLINKNIYTLPELSQFIKINISKSSSKVVDYTESINLDEDSDEDELQDEPNDSEVVDNKDQSSTNSTDEE
ncbi:unnamed protein product [Rotaria sordida]|uniref:Chitin-binding type-1 domain-containing protein n=1 Tax=Rotaria sordida TaxID=392033 RepID=A0A818QI92_9BILA|nr:unnamed protein product [Rotaria sordida]